MEDIFGMLNFLGKAILCQILFPLLSWGCMPYGICGVPFLVQCTSHLLRVVPMMCGRLACYELLLVSQTGLTVCGLNQIIQICGYRLIGGEDFLIVLSTLGWFLLAVKVCSTVEDESILIFCTARIWSGVWRFVLIYIYCLIYDYLGGLTDTWCSWKSLSYLKIYMPYYPLNGNLG